MKQYLQQMKVTMAMTMIRLTDTLAIATTIVSVWEGVILLPTTMYDTASSCRQNDNMAVGKMTTCM